MYDPTIGRFLTEDPTEYAGGDVNLYRYVHNDPTDMVDPSGLEGHHWVPVSVREALKEFLSKDAIDFFTKETSGALPYDHGVDTWLGESHFDYNGTVKQLLQSYREYKHAPKLTGKQAKEFVSWISGAAEPELAFVESNAATFEAMQTWRLGFLESKAVGLAAQELAGDKLTKKEVKLIAKKLVNGESVKGLSPEADAIIVKLGSAEGKAILRKAAGSIVPVIIFIQFATAAQKGYAEGVSGETGALGAGLAVTREMTFADLVEGTVFPLIEKAADAVENQLAPGGLGPSHDRIWQTRLNAVNHKIRYSTPEPIKLPDGSSESWREDAIRAGIFAEEEFDRMESGYIDDE